MILDFHHMVASSDKCLNMCSDLVPEVYITGISFMIPVYLSQRGKYNGGPIILFINGQGKLASVADGVSPGNCRGISRRTGELDMLLRTLGTILSG